MGSFLNVCIWRLPKNMSVVSPGSFCPHCNSPIRWYDNIPVVSFILLKRRCRTCNQKISFRYPFVEFITAGAFLFLYNKFGLTMYLFKFAFLFSILVVASFIDIDYHSIPAHLCVLGIFVGLMVSILETVVYLKRGMFEIKNMPIVFTLKGLFIGLGFAYFFKLFGDIFISLYLSLRKKDSIEGERESLGLGDVDFLGMVGTFLGWLNATFVFFVAPFIAIIYSIFALIFKKSHLIPYLPYLSAAVIVVFLWGDRLLRLLGF